MSKYKYRAVAGTMQNLFTRQLANDEVNTTTEMAQQIIQHLSGKLSEGDMAQLKKMLMGGEEDAGAPIKGGEARVAQDSASINSFNKRFPSAKRIGRDPYPGGFR
jgi:hypothetical protein